MDDIAEARAVRRMTSARTMRRTTSAETLRRMTFGALLAVLVQASIGMAVNLFVTIPAHHPGAQASDYFSGSFHSVVWAIAHGAATLAIHATLGLLIAAMTVSVVVRAVRVGRRALTAWAVVAALLVIGAGFNGASFLDYNHDANSLIMALLAFGAVGAYAAMLFLLASG